MENGYAIAVEDDGYGAYRVVVANGPLEDAEELVSYGGITEDRRARSIARQVGNYVRQHPTFPLARVECRLLELLSRLARRQAQFNYRLLVDPAGDKVSWAAMTAMLDATKARAGVPNG